jgi:hypothetical protein
MSVPHAVSHLWASGDTERGDLIHQDAEGIGSFIM